MISEEQTDSLTHSIHYNMLSALQNLGVSGVPLYCSITARDSQGLTANATCKLDMYDTTPPDARVSADFYSTSDPTRLTGSAFVVDESDIELTEVRIIYHVFNQLLYDFEYR